MAVFLKRNDVGDVIEFTCENEDGTPVSLTGATVKFNMGKKNKLITTGTANIVSASEGMVEYQLSDSDTLHAGNFPAEFEVTFASGKKKTFPTIGYLMVNIEANLDNGKTPLVTDEIATRVSAIEVFKDEINDKVIELTAQADKVNEFDARFNNLVAQSGTSSTEVIDARQSVTGTVHPSLRAYLNAIEPVIGTTTNSGNDYTLWLGGYTRTYANGQVIRFKCNAASTGNARLRVNSQAYGYIMKPNGANMAALKNGVLYTVIYDATTGNFFLQGEGGSGNATPADVLGGKTFMNDSGESAGTMSNYAGVTRTGTWQNVNTDATVDAIPDSNGYYTTGSIIQITDSDLIPANIKKGVNVFGVTGTYAQGYQQVPVMILPIGNLRGSLSAAAQDLVLGHSKSWIAISASGSNGKTIYITDRSTMKVTASFAVHPTDTNFYTIGTQKGLIVNDRYLIYSAYSSATTTYKLFNYDIVTATLTDITPSLFEGMSKSCWGTDETYGFMSSYNYLYRINSLGNVVWTVTHNATAGNAGYLIGELGGKLYVHSGSGYIKVFLSSSGAYVTMVSNFMSAMHSAFFAGGKIISSQNNSAGTSLVHITQLDGSGNPTTTGRISLGGGYGNGVLPYDKARTKFLMGIQWGATGGVQAHTMDAYDTTGTVLERAVTGWSVITADVISPSYNDMITNQFGGATQSQNLYPPSLVMTGRDIDVF